MDVKTKNVQIKIRSVMNGQRDKFAM